MIISTSGAKSLSKCFCSYIWVSAALEGGLKRKICRPPCWDNISSLQTFSFLCNLEEIRES